MKFIKNISKAVKNFVDQKEQSIKNDSHPKTYDRYDPKYKLHEAK